MKKKMLAGLSAGILAVTIFTSSAFAEVTFDASSGTGFIGKGDVQTVLNWNNQQLQENADRLNFTYESVETYEVTVEWTTGDGKKGEKTHSVTHKRSATVSGNVAYVPRKANQVNGFNLTGFGEFTAEGENVPAVGDEFPGNSGHIVTSVDLLSSSSTLQVNGVTLQ